MGAVACNVPKFVFCVGAAVGRVFLFFAVVGRVFLASNSSLIDVGAVACKVPKFVFGYGCVRLWQVFCFLPLWFLVEKVTLFWKFSLTSVCL